MCFKTLLGDPGRCESVYVFQKKMIKPTGLVSPSGGDGNYRSCQSALEATDLEKLVQLQMI